MKRLGSAFFCATLLLLSCSTENKIKITEYFFAKIDNKPWISTKYSIRYKVLSNQLSILAEAEDGSRMEVSFHDAGQLKVGNYPSTINDQGIQSGIFYASKHGDFGEEMLSTTYNVPVQENTVQLTKLDKTDKKAYVIEGTFSSIVYALHKSNPKQVMTIMGGKFRVIYRPDVHNPDF